MNCAPSCHHRGWAEACSNGRAGGLVSTAKPQWVLGRLILGLLTGCNSAKVTSQHALGAGTATQPELIYVADFDLAAEGVQHVPGMLPGGPGPLGRVEGRLSGVPQDPAERARQLVDLMTKSVVRELNQAGFTATRLVPGAPPPSTGWLVRGVFAQVQEGNRLQRAIIGFGKGQTELQVVTFVDDLAHGPLQPLYEVDTQASSGNKPGGGATLAKGPYGSAVRFAMAGHDMEKNVQDTAAEVARQIVQRLQQAPAASP